MPAFCCMVWCFPLLCFPIAIADPVPDEQSRLSPCSGSSSSSCRHRALHASSTDGQLLHYANNTHIEEDNNFFWFIKKYHRKYQPGSQIFQEKYQLYLKSLERHKYLNSFAYSSSTSMDAHYGINQFSDLPVDEFISTYLKSYPRRYQTYVKTIKSSTSEGSLPLRFDWRDKNVVMRVKNQMNCGACWAFSVVGAVESAYAIKGHQPLELSVQQVIDCSYMDGGCNGGSTVSALKWLNQTQTKLVHASEYAFKAKDGFCHYFPCTEFGVSIKGYEAYDFSYCEEEMMKNLINFGPLAVIVDAVSWQDYLGGVIQHHCSSGHPNHAVLVIGYDKTGVLGAS
ncbi:cathepsin O isoform X2 [Spea bombifrons]|uniref:cathepsin O isoform X2 n=1 Tax=Spea bombifrons TaxID=233779 RepID=UPI00234A6264|nr:cathepsin O isoform X2 [Spea bombifrons]